MKLKSAFADTALEEALLDGMLSLDLVVQLSRIDKQRHRLRATDSLMLTKTNFKSCTTRVRLFMI